MKSILLTGTAGFIGSNFVPYFLEKYPNYNLINLDLLTYAGNLENLKELEIDNGKEYIPNPFIGQYQFFTQANIESTKEDLGYEPKFEMEDGIKAYIPEIKRLFKEEVK